MAEITKQQEDQPMRFTLTHYRKAGTAHDAFMKWIVEVHLPKAIPLFKKHGITGYALFETPATFNDPLREKMAFLHPTWEVADYDCLIEYTLPSAQTIENVMTDPEWIEAVQDQEDWVDTSKALLSLGYHTQYLSEGKAINLPQ
ncbi:hypothetical protein K505DRAFT_265852 [Melanomma pulvis-pyrius CBS 109.77]|uniref:EthD domain-containing protein n=1 Tax=Melanomma pulvis-pyrius CBS 109.77 TaxID=1314802 RepID=A0A6A6XSF8_9PLEO|nr:hypothetical protein K505DRAFT_265852 [Melanomma pulvis-pyrius CBS 109.77]